MGKVLPFLTRDQYKLKELEDILHPPVKVPDTSIIDPIVMETFVQLYKICTDDLNYMVKELKKTGRWNTIAEQLMRRVYEDVKVICATLVGGNNGSGNSNTEKT